MNEEIECKTHPDAPHGFVRNASHTEDRLVCECEYWEEPKVNKRIQELMSKTLDEKFAGTWSTMDMQDLQKFSERFAELIVRECLTKIENEAAQYAEPVWAFELVNDIKEHFGVEDRAVPILSADEQALFAGITSSGLFTIEATKKAFGVEE